MKKLFFFFGLFLCFSIAKTQNIKNIAPQNKTVCQGDTVNFTATVKGNHFRAYWKSGNTIIHQDSIVDTLSSQKYSTYQFSMQVKNTQTLTFGIQFRDKNLKVYTFERNVKVFVYKPKMKIDWKNSKTAKDTLCTTNSVLFFVNILPTDELIYYKWTFGDGNDTSTTQPRIRYHYKNFYTDSFFVKLVATTKKYHCEIYDTAKIVVHQTPKANFLINSTSSCRKDNSFLIIDISKYAANGNSYWKFGENDKDTIFWKNAAKKVAKKTQTNTNFSHQYFAGTNYTYNNKDSSFTIRLYTEKNGCYDSVKCSIKIFRTPEFLPLQEYFSQEVPCANQIMSYEIDSTINKKQTVYRWQKPNQGKILYGENSTQIKVQWNKDAQEGIEKIYLSLTDTQTNKLVCKLDTFISVKINPNLSPDTAKIVFKNNDEKTGVLVCLDFQEELQYRWFWNKKNEPIGDFQTALVISPDSLQWHFCNIRNFDTAMNYGVFTFFPSHPECRQISFYYGETLFTTNIPHTKDSLDLIIAPNPSQEHFYFTLKTKKIGKIKVNIKNVNGIILKNFIFQKNNSENFVSEFYLKEFATGTYFFELSIENQTLTKPFIILR